MRLGSCFHTRDDRLVRSWSVALRYLVPHYVPDPACHEVQGRDPIFLASTQ